MQSLKELEDSATEYREKLQAAVNDSIAAKQKSRQGKWFAVSSLVFRTIGSAVDKALAPGKFAADVAVSALALCNGSPVGEAGSNAISARTKANSFLNRLWDVQARKMSAKAAAKKL